MAAGLILGAIAASCSPSGPKLISSSTVNGKTVKVFAVGSGPQNSGIEQVNDTTTLKVGAHVIVITPDGRVSVDGKETAYGDFKELDVTIGDGDKIEVKVAS